MPPSVMKPGFKRVLAPWRSPTGSRTLFRDVKSRDLTYRRWGRDYRDACEI
jgi:hypothetical protein